jgi:hypothetical protein
MAKIKLIAIGNQGDFNYYTFERNMKVLKMLQGIFYRVFKITFELQEEQYNKKGGYHEFRNINKYKDRHESIIHTKNPSKIDIFYGNKVLFLTIHCKEDLRVKFNEELAKLTFMPKPKIKESQIWKKQNKK